MHWHMPHMCSLPPRLQQPCWIVRFAAHTMARHCTVTYPGLTCGRTGTYSLTDSTQAVMPVAPLHSVAVKTTCICGQRAEVLAGQMVHQHLVLTEQFQTFCCKRAFGRVRDSCFAVYSKLPLWAVCTTSLAKPTCHPLSQAMAAT